MADKASVEKIPSKRGEISKATANMMSMVSVATLIVVFCLVGVKVLLGQAAYQRRLINARSAAVSQLKVNQTASQTLLDQYKNVFIGTNAANAIGGINDSNATAVPPNGDNSRLVLDALPTSYDFPGLLSSISSIMVGDGISSPSITGTDDSAKSDSQPSASPQPSPIKVTIGGTGTYGQVQQMIKDLERSIRPFDIGSLQLNGTNSSMSFAMDVTTYYQVAKSLDLGSQEVR